MPIYSPLPYITAEKNIFDGLVFKANKFCTSCALRTCAEDGYSSKAIGTPQTCFKGSNYVYVRDSVGQEVVWIGFLVPGRKYHADYKKILPDGFELPPATLAKLVSNFGPEGDLSSAAIEIRKRGESQALHDLTHLITALSSVLERREVKLAREASYITAGDIDILKDTVFSAHSILGAIKNQIELSDFIIAPETAEHKDPIDFDLYGLFDKNRHIYNMLARYGKKEISIRWSGERLPTARRTSETFALLPAILLQNAVKYSRPDSSISITFSAVRGKLQICVESYGPIVPDQAELMIWNQGGKYTHPNDTKKGGSGFGLYLARKICELAGFQIRYEKTPLGLVQGVPIGWNRFIVTEK